MVAHICNSSYKEDEGKKIVVLGWLQTTVWNPTWKIKQKGMRDEAQQ
jgi:hypothetical protein